jgi:hypothetical protein
MFDGDGRDGPGQQELESANADSSARDRLEATSAWTR